jgi:DNA-binding GntR family transcriptional regulator
LDAVSKNLDGDPRRTYAYHMASASRGGSGALGLTTQVERPKSLRDQVYERLRGAITSGEMPPGAPVIEAEIATRLGLSRTPVREALRRLESEGMLEPRGGRGTVVREILREEVDCVFEIREALESLAARRASRHMNARDYAELERLVERMRAHVDDADEMERLDTTFHDRILAHADGVRLKRMLGDLRAEILPWRAIALAVAERRAGTVDEHAAMLVAMKARDEPAIAAATSRHIANTHAAVIGEGDAA